MKNFLKITLVWVLWFAYVGLVAYGLHQASRMGGM